MKIFEKVAAVPIYVALLMGHLVRTIAYRVTGCDRRVPVAYVITPIIASFYLVAFVWAIVTRSILGIILYPLVALWVMLVLSNRIIQAADDMDNVHAGGEIAVSEALSRTVSDTVFNSFFAVFLWMSAIVYTISGERGWQQHLAFVIAMTIEIIQGGVAMDPTGTGGKTLPSIVRSLFAKPKLAGEAS